MNERAIRWAWCQNPPSTHKLVLLALAYGADDAGRSSPSISSLAMHCSVSTRTVRRALRDLEADSLLTPEARVRPDGSTLSNRYQLRLSDGHTVSPPPDIDVTGPGHVLAGVDDTARPGDLGHAGTATPRLRARATAPVATGAEPAGTSVAPDANDGLLPQQAPEFFGNVVRTEIGLDSLTSPPMPVAGTSPSAPPTQAVTASAPTTEKPFAYLRSVIGI